MYHSDKYVIFYTDSTKFTCGEGEILWPNVQQDVDQRWLDMVKRVYDAIDIDTPLKVSDIHVRNITKNSAKVFWDVSDYSTGQVEYGETIAYGNFNTKETSFDYNSHGQRLRNLKAGTTYHYRVISEDKQGNKVISEDHTFKTRD